MDEPPPTHHENTALLRAKALLGSSVRLERRSLRTSAGGKRGLLVYGYRIVRGGGEVDGREDWNGDAEVLGISPPAGSHIDLSRLGTPEEALQDALRRRQEGLGPIEASEGRESPRPFEPAAAADRPARPHWKPSPESTTSGFSTSSLDLPVG
jgi:hypothetical protein